MVGWVDLTGDDVRAELDRLRALPGGDRLAGVRHLVQDEPDPDWLGRPDVRRGLRAVGDAGLIYDLLVRPGQLPAALRVTAELDSVPFVLDHGGKPEIAGAQVEPWAGLISELARRPNLSCKLSGLVTEAGAAWNRETFVPYVDRILESFGPGPADVRLRLARLHAGGQLPGGHHARPRCAGTPAEPGRARRGVRFDGRRRLPAEGSGLNAMG